ncbi:hypothetical protein [Mesorhizobium sp. M0571]|uniref:hypothetical protein n=1 Tax=unclassified Mesorhizobium TaxID=325217 RepID=UPI0033350AAA
MKTDSNALEALFDTFAKQLDDLLSNGRTVVDKETGEAVRITPDAASLNVVRQFLKDTGTKPVPGTNKVVNDLASKLPFDGSEHDQDYPRH